MKNCEHLNTKKKRINYPFLGTDFSYNGLVCLDCGASLWNKEREKAFNNWLVKLYKQEQYRFQMQIGLPESSLACVEELSRRYFGVTKAAILKALTVIYIELMNDGRFKQIIRKVTDGEVYQSFQDTKKERFKVLFRPLEYQL